MTKFRSIFTVVIVPFQNLSQTQLLRQSLNVVTKETSLSIKPDACPNLVCYSKD